MRLARAVGWILGGLCIGTGGLLLGTMAGPHAGGVGIAAISMILALLAVERGMATW